MENASEALIMAFSVLVFVLALSISIHSFGQARATSEIIMERSDSTFDTTYIDADNKLLQDVKASGEKIVTRTVGAETIIPTLYRAYEENLVIVFADEEGSAQFTGGIYAQKKKDGSGWNNEPELTIENNKIDLKSLNIGADRAREFITYLLYSKNDNDKNYLQTKFMGGTGSQLYTSLRDISLYDTIVKNKFCELIGTYYYEDIETGENSSTSSLDRDVEEKPISDANKTKRRIITYVCMKNNEEE